MPGVMCPMGWAKNGELCSYAHPARRQNINIKGDGCPSELGSGKTMKNKQLQMIFLPWPKCCFQPLARTCKRPWYPRQLLALGFYMEGYLFLVFFAAGFELFLGSWFYAFLRFSCLSASLLYLLLFFSAFPAFLLLCFTCFFSFLLLCFTCFAAFLLLCLSTFTILLFLFFSYCMCFAALLPGLCFSASCLYCLFVFSFLLLYSLLFVNTLGETQRNPT